MQISVASVKLMDFKHFWDQTSKLGKDWCLIFYYCGAYDSYLDYFPMLRFYCHIIYISVFSKPNFRFCNMWYMPYGICCIPNTLPKGPQQIFFKGPDICIFCMKSCLMRSITNFIPLWAIVGARTYSQVFSFAGVYRSVVAGCSLFFVDGIWLYTIGWYFPLIHLWHCPGTTIFLLHLIKVRLAWWAQDILNPYLCPSHFLMETTR